MFKKLDSKLVREKNIAKRKVALDRQKAKALAKAKKSQILIAKHKKFAQAYSHHQTAFITKAIARIKKKYDHKIADAQARLAAIKTSQTKLLAREVDNKLIIRYYNFRLEKVKQKFEAKLQRVRSLEAVAKLPAEAAKTKINNIEIERHLNIDYYNKKIAYFKSFYNPKVKLENRIRSLKTLKASEIAAVTTRLKSTPAVNLAQASREGWATIKSLSIGGAKISDLTNSVASHLRKYSMFYILLFVIFTFYFTTAGTNLKPNNFINILESNTYIFIIGLAMLMVIVSGNIDLSVGSLMGFLGAFSVTIFNRTGNLFSTLVLTILVGALVGLVQGILIGYFKMPSFIVTLGAMLLFKGLVLWLTEAKAIIPDTETYTDFILGQMPDLKVGELYLFSFLAIILVGVVASIILTLGRKNRIKYGIGSDNLIAFSLKLVLMNLIFLAFAYAIGFSRFGLTYYIVYILLLVIIFLFIMQNTAFGRKIYAVGGNRKAAALSGINNSRIITYIFIIAGVMVGFAAIVFTAIRSSAVAAASSAGYELDVISSVFVGGASMQGGIGTVQGTVIGALILGYIGNGMILMNLGAEMKFMIKAVVLVMAVGYDIFSHRKVG